MLNKIGLLSVAAGMAAALAAPLPGHARMYKWVDEQGVTHYSQQPPPGGQAEELRAPPPPASDPKKLQKQTEEKMKAFEKRREAERQKQQEAKEKKQREAKLREHCAQMRENLRVLRTYNRIQIKEGDTYRTAPEEERQRRIRDLQQRIQENCQDQ